MRRAYTLVLDVDEHEKPETTAAFVGSALHAAFGDDYELRCEDGARIRFDSWAADHEHEGHDQVVTIEPDA